MRRCISFLSGRHSSVVPAFAASDMDGTILSPEHKLTPFAKKALYKLTCERQVPFIFATGRLHADVEVISHNLRDYFLQQQRKAAAEGKASDAASAAAGSSPPAPMFLVTSNGAAIHDATSGKLIAERPIAADMVRTLYDYLPTSETRINTHLYQHDRWYCRMNWEEMLQFYKESGLTFDILERLPTAAASSSLSSTTASVVDGNLESIIKLSFTCWDLPRLQALEAALHEEFGEHLTVTFSSAYCVDVTAKGVNKASALEHVFSLLPLRPEEEKALPRSRFPSDEERQRAVVEHRMAGTVAFGDDVNDVGMLRGVGWGHVMQNCNPRVKELCPELEVIGTHAEDAVARRLCRVFDLDLEHHLPSKQAEEKDEAKRAMAQG